MIFFAENCACGFEIMNSWMRDNYDVLAERRLSDIILPGTHDSAAYVLASGNVVNCRNKVLSLLARFAHPCVAPWTLTQHFCVHRQLSEAGVRFLDLRVAWDDARNDFATSHTFACAPLKTVLFAIMDFLSENSKEIVVCSVRPDWPYREQFAAALSDKLLATLSSTCRGYLYPRQPQLPTIVDMVKDDRRLIVFVEDVSAQQSSKLSDGMVWQEDLWVSTGCRCIWANSDTPEGTVNGLLEIITKLRHEDALKQSKWWYVSAAVTPTACSVIRNILASPRGAGLRRLAALLEARELPRLMAEGLGGIGAVCLDHPSPEAMAAVIQLNLRIGPSVN